MAVADQTDEQDPNATTQPKKATAVPGTPISVANVPPVSTNPVTPNVPQLAPISATSAAAGPAQTPPAQSPLPVAPASPARVTTLDQDKQQMKNGGSLGDAGYRGLHFDDLSGNTVNDAGVAWNGSDPNADPIIAAWDAYSPNAALTEQQKGEAAAAQGAPSSLAYSGDPSNPLNAAKLAELATAGKSVLAGTQDAQAKALAGTNAAIGANNATAADALTADQTAYDDAIGRGAGNSISYDGKVVPTGTSLPQSAVGGSALTPGNGSDTGGQSPSSILRAGTPTGSATAPAVSTAPTLTPTDPGNPLTAQTISTNPTANRFAIANQQLQDTIHNTLDPQFKADMLAADAHDFGEGRGVSGQHRTGIGNLELAKANNENQSASSFLNPALAGTIGDQENAASRAERQQTFQKSQQDDLFGQNVTTKQLEDQLTNSAANRAAQQSAIGEANSPSQVQLILSQISAGGAQQAGSAAANALKQAGIDSSKMTPQQAIQAYLRSLGIQA